MAKKQIRLFYGWHMLAASSALRVLGAGLHPQHHILHVPFTPPTLIPIPGLYLKSIAHQRWQELLKRATESLSIIFDTCGQSASLLVENINYSLVFLEPLAQSGYCKICLDVGHLLLGQESVMAAIKRYISEIREIHLHGIKNHMDHYSLALLPQERLARWMKHLIRNQYDGIINLEVFSPRDLMVSLELLGRTPNSPSAVSPNRKRRNSFRYLSRLDSQDVRG